MKTIAILATLDTKAAEADFMRQQIERLGGKALLINIGVLGSSAIEADVTKEEIIEAGGGSYAELMKAPHP